MPEIDKVALRVLVFEKTGIKIDDTDPSFAVALMAEVLLLHAAADVEARISQAEGNMAEQTAKLENAIRQIMTHLQELANTAGVRASERMKEAREVQEAAMRENIADAANRSVEKAVNNGIGRLYEALKVLEVSALKAEQKVAAAAKASRPGWSLLILGVVVISAILGGAGGYLASRLL